LVVFRAWYCDLTYYTPALDANGNQKYDKAGNPLNNTVMKRAVTLIEDKATGDKYVVDAQTGQHRSINPDEEVDLPVYIWVIILNILSILYSLVGFLSVGFIIYGGYLYVLAQGEADKAAKGKKTITRAITGLVIVILASAITNTIISILIQP
jgi:hypothetical protein